MHKLNENGSLVAPLVITIVLLLGSLGFAGWAYVGRQDFKDNVDKKIDAAVVVARQEEATQKDTEFTEKEKSPFKTYTGPVTFGSIAIIYPKTWSSHVIENSKNAAPIAGFFHPDYVPDVAGATAFAFRLEVVNTPYDQVLKTFDATVKTGKTKVSAYRAPKVESVLGSRIEGELSAKKEGEMVLLPLRDKTIKLWTEGSEFRSDFTSIILANLTFTP